MSKETIIKELPKLKKRELKEVKDNIDLLLRNNQEDCDDYEVLYSLVTAMIKYYTKQKFPPYYLFKKRNKSTYKKLIEVTEYLNDYYSSIMPEYRLTKIRKQKGYQLYASLRVKNIIKSTLPLTLPVIFNSYEFFPALLEKKFPGYIQSGLIKYVFQIPREK